jgi:ABC-type branched-subunit amino acid transport system substrate-binding protein
MISIRQTTRRISRLATVLSICLLLNMTRLHAEEQKPTIGVVAPLSGYIASIGTAIRNGIDLAQSENVNQFNSVNLRFEDDQHDPKLALTAYRKLRAHSTPGAIMAFGFFFPTVMGRTVLQDQVPLINLSFVAKPAIGNSYIIRSMNHTAQYGKALAEFLASERQLEYPVITTEYDFFLQLIDDTVARLADIKPEVKITKIAQILPSERDFRALVAKLKATGVNRVGVFLLTDQLITFMRQARENGLIAEIFGAALCETAAKTEGAGRYLEGCIYPDNEVSAEFRSKYRAKFGNESQLTFAGAGYDMSNLLAEHFKAHPNSSARETLTALSQVRDRQGVLGKFSFKDDPTFGKFFEYPVAVKKISNGVGVAVR